MIRFITTILFVISMSIPKNTVAQDLKDYRWQNRILLLIDESIETDALKSQLTELTSYEKKLLERDLIIFLVSNDTVYFSDKQPSNIASEQVYLELGVEPDFKGVILIGKDGGIKLREPYEVAAKTIFALIDSMPMRKAEMRKGKR